MTKQKTRVFSILIVVSVLLAVLPVQAIANESSDAYSPLAAGDYPSTPTEGIVSGQSYVIRTLDKKYFGFTTRDALCDDEPTDDNTEWDISYVGDGKYCITFANNQRYGFLNAYEDTVMPAPNYELWYIIRNSDGTYRLCPTNDYGRYLVATEDPVTHLTTVSALDPVETPNANERNWDWEIIPYSARVEVEAYYDTGFKIVYGSNNSTTSSNRILSIVNQSQELFFQNFGVYLSNTAKGYKQSLCDVCKNPTTEKNRNVICKHYANYTDQHTYWNKLADYFADNNPLSSYFQKQVLFVGSQTFKDNGSKNGVSCSYPPTIGSRHGHVCIMKIYGTSLYDSRQGMVYAHEMSHQFGAPDHYCSYITKNNKLYCLNGNYCINRDHGPAGKVPRSESCIMDNMGNESSTAYYYKTSLSAWSNLESVFCTQCKNDMKSYIAQYYDY